MTNYGGYFDIDGKRKRSDELSSQINSVDFWNDKDNANKVIAENNNLQESIESLINLKIKIDNNIETISLLIDNPLEELIQIIEEDIENIDKEFNRLKLETILNNPNDKNDAILEIHAGAGGTESCDWALMLMRMYTRYCEQQKYKYEVIDTQPGEEAGIKSATIIIKGLYAYGYLKAERGVHRLIRISPFDANSRRHTSFASVEVIPEVNEDINIEIKEAELRIDVYRSSGAGGQSVNTTDSAVRITHIPTNIVVTCQNERSQIKNKEKALEILKSKLYQLEIDKQNKNLNDLKNNQMGINFGSQIRSYVMHPYMMVKDHRTNVETSNVNKVLDGDINIFIESYLKEVINDNN